MSELRAGDADRDRTAAVLREAHAEGRLDLDELDQRLSATYSSRTLGELARLTADLPTPSLPDRPTPAPVARPGDAGQERRAWTAWAAAVAINVVIWAVVSVSAGAPVYFWPIWVAGPWGAVLAIGWLSRRS